jgi:drug/metabolite transporter (DMT)-like permease
MMPVRANGIALLAALAWGLGNVSQKTILEHLDGFSAMAITCGVGAMVLAPLLRRERPNTVIAGTGLVPLLLKVSALFAVAATLLQFGFGHTSVTNAGFLVNTSAVITPAIAWLCFGQRQPPWIWPACLCTMIGVMLLSGGRLNGMTFGDVLCLLSAVVFSFWIVMLGQLVRTCRIPVLATVVQLLVCGGACTVLGLLTYGAPPLSAVIAAIPEILLIGVLSRGLAYMLNAVAQQHIQPVCAAVIMSAEAVFGTLCAMVWIGETLVIERVAGAVLITLGVIAVSCLPSNAAPALAPANGKAHQA